MYICSDKWQEIKTKSLYLHFFRMCALENERICQLGSVSAVPFFPAFHFI